MEKTGKSPVDVASLLGVSLNTVYRFLRGEKLNPHYQKAFEGLCNPHGPDKAAG